MCNVSDIEITICLFSGIQDKGILKDLVLNLYNTSQRVQIHENNCNILN
jgi:hypothetical protein